MRFYHDSGLAFSKATAGRKDHADPAPPPPSADLWVWRLHKGRLQWLFFGLSALLLSLFSGRLFFILVHVVFWIPVEISPMGSHPPFLDTEWGALKKA